jgi:hypothetical protein
MGARTNRIAKTLILWAPICGVLSLGACASSSRQASTEMLNSTNTAPDGGFTTPPPSKKGVIVPGDISSGTAGLGQGAGSGNMESTTGTSGTRVNPGGAGDGK